MRQGWIEFKRDGMKANDEHNFLLRPEYIVAIDGKEGKDITEIQYDTGSDQLTFYASEPYEQVKQKIIEDEKMELSDVVVERFTREEYKYLLNVMIKYGQAPVESPEDSSMYLRIRDKLNEILYDKE